MPKNLIMQNEKTEGVNDEQYVKMMYENLQTETKHANEQTKKKLMRRRNKLIWHKQNNNKENTLRSYNIISQEWFMIHEKNNRGLRFKLTIKIDISYGMSFLTEFPIAPKLQMDSIIPFKKKKTNKAEKQTNLTQTEKW